MVNFCQILITMAVMFSLQNKEDIKKRQHFIGVYESLDFD